MCKRACLAKQHEHSYSHMYCYHLTLYGYVCDQKTSRIVDLQMRMLGLRKRKKREGGLGGEGAAPPPQSGMNIAILTCIAIT